MNLKQKNMTKINEIDFYALQNEAYRCACYHGFHEKKMSDETYLMLVITELSEAVEADRRGKRANIEKSKIDRLLEPKRLIEDELPFIRSFERNIKDTIEDELADAVIRLLDLAGVNCMHISIPSLEIDHESEINITDMIYYIISEYIANKSIYLPVKISYSIAYIFAISETILNVDLMQFINLKMSYNRLRPYLHNKKY